MYACRYGCMHVCPYVCNVCMKACRYVCRYDDVTDVMFALECNVMQRMRCGAMSSNVFCCRAHMHACMSVGVQGLECSPSLKCVPARCKRPPRRQPPMHAMRMHTSGQSTTNLRAWIANPAPFPLPSKLLFFLSFFVVSFYPPFLFFGFFVISLLSCFFVFTMSSLPSLGSPGPSEDSPGNLNSLEAIFRLSLAARLLRLGYSHANVTRCVVFCCVDGCLFRTCCKVIAPLQ